MLLWLGAEIKKKSTKPSFGTEVVLAATLGVDNTLPMVPAYPASGTTPLPLLGSRSCRELDGRSDTHLLLATKKSSSPISSGASSTAVDLLCAGRLHRLQIVGDGRVVAGGDPARRVAGERHHALAHAREASLLAPEPGGSEAHALQLLDADRAHVGLVQEGDGDLDFTNSGTGFILSSRRTSLFGGGRKSGRVRSPVPSISPRSSPVVSRGAAVRLDCLPPSASWIASTHYRAP